MRPPEDHWGLKGYTNEPSTQREILRVLLRAPAPMRAHDVGREVGVTQEVARKALLRLVKKGVVLAEKLDIPTTGKLPYPGWKTANFYSINREKLK